MSQTPVSPTIGAARFSVREWGTASAVSLCVAMAVLGPFFLLGTASGHDVAFHMSSWLDAAGQWQQGVVLPRWTEWANFGFGEPRFIFYPPLSWLFGALLGTLFPWNAVAAIFIGSVQTFAGIAMYALLRRVTARRSAALLGAAGFAANPYALLIIYLRSDFAELLAMAFFPLAIAGLLRLTGELPDAEERPWREAGQFALPFCAIWLSNAPAAVIITYSSALLIAIGAIRKRSLRALARGAAGMALGLGLAGFYLLPAAYEQRWVNIGGALYGGLKPAENFLYATTSDPEHDAFNRIASNLAVFLIAWLLLAAAVAWNGGVSKRQDGRGETVKLPVVMLGTASGLLMLRFTGILWQYAPELRFLQFPWRWMSVSAVCALILTAIAAGRWRKPVWVAVLGLAILTTGLITGHYLVRNAWWDTEDMPTLLSALKQGAGFEGTDEYDPQGDDRTDLPQKQARAIFTEPGLEAEKDGRAKISIERWTAEHRELNVLTPKAAHLLVHLLDYPAWKVMVNGKTAEVRHAKNTRQMSIAVPEGESRVSIDLTRTKDRTAGGCLSLASIAVTIGIFLWSRRKEAPTA